MQITEKIKFPRRKAFILTEQVLTMMLQVSFMLVLCSSFYLLTEFYGKTQRIITARNHAERAILFFDDKIQHAGLGLWRCKDSATIRRRLEYIHELKTKGNAEDLGYRLPLAITREKDNTPSKDSPQNSGNVLTLLYAIKSHATGEDNELITAFSNTITESYSKMSQGTLSLTGNLLDSSEKNLGLLNNSTILRIRLPSAYINSYAVMESVGVPLHLSGLPSGQLNLEVLNVQDSEKDETITIPAGGELLGLRCMQIFVNNDGAVEEDGGQLAYRELTVRGDNSEWDKTYNQEVGILDIYMERDDKNNTFSLWVLATGGYDESVTNPRPESWPDEANPRPKNNGEDAKTAWLDSTYCHHTVYVARATWKLNNIPDGFTWN